MIENTIQVKEGDIVTGTVDSIDELGVFLIIDGARSLLHYTDIKWGAKNGCQYQFNIGDKIKVKILIVNHEKNLLTVGVKHLFDNPWDSFEKKLKQSLKFIAKITQVTDYGYFADIEDGVTGFIHKSDIVWGELHVNPSDHYTEGQSIEVLVLMFNCQEKRLSLSIKHCSPNPTHET